MDVREFQEKLKKMQELAKEQGGSLRAEQIREEFSGSDLNSSQLVNVLKYLTGQGILIEGIETETEGSDAQEEVRRGSSDTGRGGLSERISGKPSRRRGFSGKRAAF